jgi:hypothetical protein
MKRSPLEQGMGRGEKRRVQPALSQSLSGVVGLLTTNNYGAVVQHIEPSHLREIRIPDPNDTLKKKISGLITKSFCVMSQTNLLIKRKICLSRPRTRVAVVRGNRVL